MQLNKKNKPSFLKQVIIFEAIIFIVLMAWYMHRLSTIDTVYVEMSLDEEIKQIEKDVSKYLEEVNSAVKNAATQIVESHNNIAKSIEFLRNKVPKLPVNKISWLGAEDKYMYLSGPNQELNRNTDGSLIRRGIEKPWVMVLGGKSNILGVDANSSDAIPAVFSVAKSDGKYLGSFLLLLDTSFMKKTLDNIIHMDQHPELSYAIFSKKGNIIVSSDRPDEVDFLRKAIDDNISGHDEVITIPSLYMFGIGRSYQIKNLSISGYDYNIIMMINHRVAFDNSIHRFRFASMDIVLLWGICICVFFFIRHKFIIPVIDISKAANIVDTGAENKVCIEEYTTRELSDLSEGLQMLITKHHKLIDSNNKLAFALKQLEVLKQERMEFARNIQHVLRTPIGHIIGGSEVLLSQFMHNITPDGMEYLEMINKSSKDLLTAVNNIIGASGLEAGNIKLEEVDCNVKKVLEEVVSGFASRIGQSHLSLNMNIANNLPDVYIDLIWFGAAIFNLIDNAVKFSNDGGVINIVAKRTAAGIVISVEDSGNGMSSAQLGAIEELFENDSASANIATTKQGIGLGLTIAHHILDLHDATLVIESTEGVGTKVVIIIPNIRIK